MRATGRLVAAALAALVLGAGGGAGGGGGGGGGGGEARLTPDSPSARLGLGAPERDLLGLRLRRIDNPRMTPFGVVVSQVDGTEIGRFSVFPPDRTGDYVVSLTPGERAGIVRNGAVEARLDLDAPAPGLAVEIVILPNPPSARP